MKTKKYGYIYKLTNTVNNKCYIGQTIQKPYKRFQKYKNLQCITQPKIYRALKKYGPLNFIYEIIDDTASNQDELNFLEEIYILCYNSREFGYNSKEGGNAGGKSSLETRQKISQATSGKNNPMYGRKRKGTYSKETKQKISNALQGRVISYTTKQKMSIKAIEREHNRRMNGWSMPENAKKRISLWVTANKEKLYNDKRNQKMALSKTGTKRQYLQDGTFIMVKPIDTSNAL